MASKPIRALLLLAFVGLTGVQHASAQAVNDQQALPGWEQAARGFFPAHCAVPQAEEGQYRLNLQRGDLDGDGRVDFYTDIPPDLLEVRQCDAAHVRLTWLSSAGYAYRPIKMSAGPASPSVGEAQPSESTSSASPSDSVDRNSPPEASPDEATISPQADKQLSRASAVAADPTSARQAAAAAATSTSQRPSQTWSVTDKQRVAALLSAVGIGVLFVGLLVLWGTGSFLRVSTERYGYRPLLNFANVLYLLIVPLLVAGAIKPASLYPLAIGGLFLWFVRMVINMRRTSVGYGLVLSIVQLIIVPILVVGGWILRGWVMSRQNPRRYISA